MTQSDLLEKHTDRIRVINAMDTCNRTRIYGKKFRRMDKEKRLEIIDLVLDGQSMEQAYHSVKGAK